MRSKIFLSVAFLVFSLAASSQEIRKWQLKELDSAIVNAEQPTIFNFWATFCKPCLAEMPHFQSLAEKYSVAGLQLVFVSLDLPDDYSRIPGVLKRFNITAPAVFLNETNADEFCPVVDKAWTGAIPATLLINNKSEYRAFFEEEMSKEKLEQLIIEMLKSEF